MSLKPSAPSTHVSSASDRVPFEVSYSSVVSLSMSNWFVSQLNSWFSVKSTSGHSFYEFLEASGVLLKEGCPEIFWAAVRWALSHDRASEDVFLLACHVATVRSCPRDLFDLLVLFDDPQVLVPLAANSCCPPQILASLAVHPDPMVRASVASNVSAPAEVLGGFVDDVLSGVAVSDRDRVRIGVSLGSNSALSASSLAKIFFALADAGVVDDWGFCNNPSTPLSVLEHIVGLGVPLEILAVVGRHSNCSDTLFSSVVSSLSGSSWLLNLIEGMDVSRQEFLGFVRSSSVEVCAAAAANPSCPPDLLEQLSYSAAVAVRAEVAANSSCPPSVLTRLISESLKDGVVQDGCFPIVCTAAENRFTPAQALVELSEAAVSSAGVQGVLFTFFAANPNCPPEVFARAAATGVAGLRMATHCSSLDVSLIVPRVRQLVSSAASEDVVVLLLLVSSFEKLLGAVLDPSADVSVLSEEVFSVCVGFLSVSGLASHVRFGFLAVLFYSLMAAVDVSGMVSCWSVSQRLTLQKLASDVGLAVSLNPVSVRRPTVPVRKSAGVSSVLFKP